MSRRSRVQSPYRAYCDLTATHQSLFKIWWSQQLLCSYSNLPKQSLYLLYMNIALNASCIRVTLCFIWRQTFTETYSKYLYHYLWPDAGSIPVAAHESVGLVPMENCIVSRTILFDFCFIYANMPELVQGGRLKIDCVRTRGFEPHC